MEAEDVFASLAIPLMKLVGLKTVEMATEGKFFQRAIAHLSTVDRVDHQGLPIAVLNLLRATLNEVEADVEDLVGDLAEKMCEPMVEYVEGVKADLINGTCLGLVGLVKETARDWRRRGIRPLLQKRAELRMSSSRLREAEDNVRKLRECLKFLAETSTKGTKAFASHKNILGKEKDEANDEKLLWELLIGKEEKVSNTRESTWTQGDNSSPSSV